MDRARCFKCHKLSHLARECTASLDSPGSTYHGTTFTPGYSYSRYRPSPHSTRCKGSNVFDEEVADIAQVHCDSELFEFELSISPPYAREIFVETLNFGSILEPLVLFLTLSPFVSFLEPAVFQNNRSSLSHAEFVEEAIQDFPCRIRHYVESMQMLCHKAM